MSERHQQFQSLLKSNAEAVEALLERLLSTDLQAGEIARPERLLAAMRHGVLNGGKRLRPFLVIESAALFPDVLPFWAWGAMSGIAGAVFVLFNRYAMFEAVMKISSFATGI